MMTAALNPRVHTYARPETRERMIWFFTTILGCEALSSPDAKSPASGIVAFRFSDGSSLSVEFKDDALDETQARLGAWVEVGVDDADDVQKRITAAGITRIRYAVNDHFYVQAPGGQVMRIVPRPTTAT